MTSDSVRLAGAEPDLNHRDPEYLGLIHETKARLLSVYDGTAAGWHPYLLGGSGTLAVEAMIASVINSGPVLIIENGYYSSRIREIFTIHKISFRALTHDWLDGWDFDAIERELDNGYEAVIGVQNETTTGRLNDIARLAAMARGYGAKCLIDAMSSFGADEIDFTNLDAVCASGNKCLHSVPGVAFVLVKDNLAREMKKFPRRSYYMSLPMYAGDSPPLTPPVPALLALRQALREYPAAGVLGRRRDYEGKAKFLREQLASRGFTSPVPFKALSCTLTTFSLPVGFNYERWFELNCEKGFVIYGCKGHLRDGYFQVSNMGELTLEQLSAWVDAVDEILASAPL